MRLLVWQSIALIDPFLERFRELAESLGTSSLDPIARLKAHPEFTPADAAKLARFNSRSISAAEAKGIRAVEASEFGDGYLQSSRPHPYLFLRGQLDAFQQPGIAIVGTRKATTYGKAVAQKFAERLASVGLTVISGGAFGIDEAAHLGALKADGLTASVLGRGVDEFYPKGNRELFEKILERGAMVSQFALGAPSQAQNFLARNYTIAALSLATVVVEAPETSGALSTARHAAEMGREVFVVPGPITHEGFKGSHALIRDGATLVDHPDQVLEAIGWTAPAVEPTSIEGIPAQILEIIGGEPMSSDRIAELTGIGAAELLQELTMMELEGLVRRDPGGYSRC